MVKKLIVFLLLLMVPVIVLAYQQGDVDGNGRVASMDYIMVRKHLLKQSTLTGENLSRADVNSDGKVSSLDFVAIRKIILNGTTTPTATPTPKPTATPTPKPTNTPVPTATPTPKPTSTPTPTATPKNKIRLLFIGNSKTFYNMYREFTINIAVSKGYEFVGKQPTSCLTKYNNSSNDYFKKNLTYSKDINNSYYSYTKGGEAFYEHYKLMNGVDKQIFENLKIDYVIMQEQTDTMLDYDKYKTYAKLIIELLTKNNPDLKIFIRNTWVLTDSSKADRNKAKKNTEKMVKEFNDSKLTKNPIKIIQDGEIIYKAQNDYKFKMFVDTRHPNYLATYATALATNKALFGIDPTKVDYVPDILNFKKYKDVKGNPAQHYKSNTYDTLIKEEQSHVKEIKKIVNNIQK